MSRASGASKFPGIHGLLAEFEKPEGLIVAANAARVSGFRDMDAYTPFPIEQLSHALGSHRSKMPLIVLIGGVLGAVGGFGLQYWVSVIAYPLNIGGRPLNSWPAFIPPTFETTVLCAAGAAVFGMLALNGLPMPYHPVFNVERFRRASRDRYFLCIQSTDPKFDLEKTRSFLERFAPVEVTLVEE